MQGGNWTRQPDDVQAGQKQLFAGEILFSMLVLLDLSVETLETMFFTFNYDTITQYAVL